ncbi:MAG: hypothetical protein AAGA37_21995 [Actinomycetota bacterium]
MSKLMRSLILVLSFSLIATACGDDDDDTAATDPATGSGVAAPDDPDPSPEDEPVPEDAEAETEVADLGPPVAALIVRSVTGELDTFIETRDAYVADLEAQDGIVHDREFLPFLSFSTFSQPEPPVYIGLTSGESLPQFGAAADAVDPALAGAYFPTFGIEVFGILQPLESGSPVDISAIATEPGQVLEVAWRDLSAYENFDPAAYETARDAYLAELASMEGFVEEYQWVSADGGSLAVGMTVYESADAFQAIATDADFNASDVYGAFVGGYPIAGGYASTSLK